MPNNRQAVPEKGHYQAQMGAFCFQALNCTCRYTRDAGLVTVSAQYPDLSELQHSGPCSSRAAGVVRHCAEYGVLGLHAQPPPIPRVFRSRPNHRHMGSRPTLPQAAHPQFDASRSFRTHKVEPLRRATGRVRFLQPLPRFRHSPAPFENTPSAFGIPLPESLIRRNRQETSTRPRVLPRLVLRTTSPITAIPTSQTNPLPELRTAEKRGPWQYTAPVC
ncbi:hypothetical protein J3F83DRAFT_348841 [Trichoderma novae-zelandiae]